MVANKMNTNLPAALLGEAGGVLLVISSTEDVAKRIESYLRNAGRPLRAAWINDLEDLEDVLRRNPPDLVLYDMAIGVPPLNQVVELCAKVRPDLPVIALATEHTIEQTSAALAAGAQDLVVHSELGHLEHLEQVVIRELVKHFNLRALRMTQERLAEFESRHHQLAENTADPVAHVQEGIVISTNPAFAHLLGYDSASQLAGQPLIDMVDASQQSKIKERLRAVQKGKHNGAPLELSLVGNHGKVNVTAQLILGSADGESVIDLLIRSERRKTDTVASQPAYEGRAAFAAAIAEPGDGVMARGAMLLKIDALTALEARIGAVDAEAILGSVAKAVHSRLGPQDQSFTFSTDEIAVLVNRASPIDIEQFGTFLCKEIAGQIYTASNYEAQITISVAVFPLGGQEKTDDVIRQLVDEVRKLSSRSGNDALVLGATAKANQSDREEARKAAKVRKSIEENRLKLAFQSIASLEGESRSHFDVLVRMVDEEGNEQHAAEFLPAAARYNLMRTIDRWVVTRALGVIAKRSASKEVSVLFVKISEDTLKDAEAFIAWLKLQIGDQPLKSDEITFEIQELVLQNHIRKAKVLTHALLEMGAGLAIEHYGIGAHSVQMLDHIPAHYLKFHPSYTQKFAEKETQKRLTEFVQVAKTRDIKTIVSHVEDANVMARLWQMGVNFIQGYHVQEPEVVLLSSEVGRRS
jgi:PAS domain S-box-containing protein